MTAAQETGPSRLLLHNRQNGGVDADARASTGRDALGRASSRGSMAKRQLRVRVRLALDGESEARSLRRRHPYISVDLHARAFSGVRQGLKTGEVDVGIFLGRPVDPDLAYVSLMTERFVVAGPAAWKDHIDSADWAGLGAMPLGDAQRHSSMAYAVMLKQLFGDRGVELNTVVQYDNEAVGRSMVHAGVGDDGSVPGRPWANGAPRPSTRLHKSHSPQLSQRNTSEPCGITAGELRRR
jgi:hypothetical protein